MRTALVAIAKNEGRYLLEWLAFHQAVGFTHAFIYDNDSDDETAELLDLPGVREFTTRISWPRDVHPLPQQSAYADWLKRFRADFEWVVTLDLDEFLLLHRHDCLADFLREFPFQTHAIGINWRMFGSSGQTVYALGLVIERFTQAASADFGPNHLVKSIARTAALRTMHIHTHELVPDARFISASGVPLKMFPAGRQSVCDHSIAQVNHYFVKSREEWSLKRARGNADHRTDQAGHIRDDGEFGYNDRNDETDTSALRYRDAVRATLAEWDAPVT